MIRDLHVVIPTIGRESVHEVIEGLVEHEQRLSKIVVVSQDCAPVVDENIREICAEARISIVETNQRQRIGCARARRQGADDSQSPWLGFIDDDIIFEAGSLSNLIITAEQRSWAGVSGVVVGDERNSLLYRFAKSLFFRGIFRDERHTGVRRRTPFESSLLLGGITVIQRSLYDQVSHLADLFGGYSWGEDAIISYAASRTAKLGIDPRIRAQNRTFGNASAATTSYGVARARSAYYRKFAELFGETRRDWLSYALAAFGSSLQGLVESRDPRLLRDVRDEWCFVGRKIVGRQPEDSSVG